MKNLFLGIASLIIVMAVSMAISFSVLGKGGETIPDKERPTPFVVPVLFDTTVSNETSTAASPHYIDVPVASIAVFQISAVGANAGASNVVFSFNTSLDGVHWTTTYPLTATLTLNGTNPVTQVFALGTNILGRGLSFDRVATTQTNLVTLSNPSVTFLPAP